MMRKGAASIVEADLHEFADGQSSLDRRAAIAVHLGLHPHEAARVAAWQRQNELIRASFAAIGQEPVPVSLALGATTASRFAAAPVHPARLAAFEPRARQDLPPMPAPAAQPGSGVAGFIFGASIALALAGGGLLLLGSRDAGPIAQMQPARDLAMRAIEAHRAFAGEPPETAAKGAALQHWLLQRTGVAVPLPDAGASGLVATGGRVIPGENGAIALLLLEGPGGERYALAVANAPPAAGAAQAVYSEQAGLGVSVATGNAVQLALAGKGGREKMLRAVMGLAGRK